MADLFSVVPGEPARQIVAPGATWLRRWLSLDEQRQHAARPLPDRLDEALHEWVGLATYALMDRTSAWFPAPE